MKQIVKHNLIITILQFLLFAALLFAVFFIKFRMDKKSANLSASGFVIERNEY
jgi:hypothetical protein